MNVARYGNYKLDIFLQLRLRLFLLRAFKKPLKHPNAFRRALPYTLNASTGLVCRPVGGRVELERKSVARVLDEANPSLAIWPLPVTPEHGSDEHAR
ncbi:MAG: hypothetical protein ACPL07_02915 [Candidatus Bathyarchaeia archaeon]